MPRSSRRRSSKHSSRDVRDYSDSEDYSSSRGRKSRDDSNGKVSKDSASREKRKLEAKDIDVDFKEEYSTSKRRRDRVDDGDDRWNGGDDDSREGTKKLKNKSSESRSRRRDENSVVYVESDEMVKKSSRKTEGKHRDSSSKKEGKEGGWEKDKEREREKEKEKERGRGKEGKTEKLIDADDLSTIKQASEKIELGEHMDSLPDRRIRNKRDDFSDGDLNHDDLGDSNDRHLLSRGDVNKDGRLKEEKRKDERHKDKYRESMNTDYMNQDDNQTNERAGKDHISDKSDYKNSRDDKDNVDIRQKKHRPLDGDRDSERDHDRDFDASGDNDRGSYRREREQDRYRGRERDRKHDREWDRKRDIDRDREREHDQDRSIDYDVLPIDDRTGRYKDSKGRKRSLDDYDDYADTKSRDFKTDFFETEKRSLNSRIESDDDRGKSQPHQERAGNNAGSDNANSLVAADECRQHKQEDMKYKDNVIEHRSSKSVSSRDVTGTPGASERNSKHRSSEKHNKDEGDTEQLSIERSSTSKASPMGVMDRSPSSKILDRRYTSRSGVRRNLGIEESGRRSNTSMGSRDDDRQNRDLPPEKSLMDDSTSVDSPFYNRTSQSNMAPSFRGGIGRGQGNAWRGGPNWTPHLPNGYIPFQHGPHHGAFPAMLPQFPSPLFGVRPTMETNHSGIPYHISGADRFASHIGPLGWQTMHQWDGNNGVFRDEQNLYGGPDWDQSRHSMNSQGWEGNSEKGQNGNVNSDISKEDISSQAHVDDVSAGQGGQRPHKEGYRAKAADTKTSSPECTLENIAATPKSLEKENEPPYDAYLSWLDISAELADPEMYEQIASFLNVKQSVIAEEDFTMLVNLKDGGRAVPKSSSVLLSSLMFSATSDSVFQRAMGIYKRQRACLGGSPIANALTDAILGSKMEEEVPPNNNKTATEEPVLDHNDEVSNVNSVDTKAGSFSPVEEPDDKPMMDSSTSETEGTPSNVEVGISKTETKGSSNLNSEEEMQGKCGPLGSPTTELESVILSRIHHSPESTH